MSTVTEVKGVITTDDGETREFFIDHEYGWHQWGNSTEKLGDTVDAVEAMTGALYEHMEDNAS